MDLLIIAISAFFLILIAFVLREISFKKQLITDSNKRTKEEVKELIKELEFKLHEAERERLGEFNALKTILQEHKILTGELKESTEGLKNVLSNNQSRG
ncbi:MAG: hypothetical protein PHT67_03120, partial [Candidatus Pacebacteria bacterium]|nr:hypothetical protein [Candidatus Paceibacterota bacterium]